MSLMGRASKAVHSYRKNRLYGKSKGDDADVYIKTNSPAPLSDAEKQEIDKWWAQFGVRFKDYNWHTMFYHMTGIKDPRFIPHPFTRTVITPYYNDRQSAKYWTDKNYFERFLPTAKFPEVYGRRIRGLYYDSEHNIYSEDEVDTFCEALYKTMDGANSFVVKKTTNSNQGMGVKLLTVNSAADCRAALKEFKSDDDLVIQKVLKQHPFFAQFNESSVNIVRVTTMRLNKEIVSFVPCVRFGMEGYFTDIVHVDGLERVNAIGICENGDVMDYSINLQGEKHPFTGAIKTVPQWEKLMETAKKGHEYLEQFGFIAWDLTVNEEGEVICIEYNLRSPASATYQMAAGPMFGERSEEVLSFLKKKENQNKYLPGRIKL